jgi:hypothetical protein
MFTDDPRSPFLAFCRMALPDSIRAVARSAGQKICGHSQAALFIGRYDGIRAA